MPSKFIKEDQYLIIERLTIEEIQREKKMIKEGEIIEEIIEKGIKEFCKSREKEKT